MFSRQHSVPFCKKNSSVMQLYFFIRVYWKFWICYNINYCFSNSLFLESLCCCGYYFKCLKKNLSAQCFCKKIKIKVVQWCIFWVNFGSIFNVELFFYHLIVYSSRYIHTSCSIHLFSLYIQLFLYYIIYFFYRTSFHVSHLFTFSNGWKMKEWY